MVASATGLACEIAPMPDFHLHEIVLTDIDGEPQAFSDHRNRHERSTAD
jgi:hypothetical protein